MLVTFSTNDFSIQTDWLRFNDISLNGWVFPVMATVIGFRPTILSCFCFVRLTHPTLELAHLDINRSKKPGRGVVNKRVAVPELLRKVECAAL